jgi:hypothetical protein
MNDLSSRVDLAIATDGWAESGLLIKSTSESYLIPQIFKRLAGKEYSPTRQVDSLYNGFLYFRNQIPGTQWDRFKSKTNDERYNQEQVEYFIRMIDTLKARGIKEVIVNPPIWKEQRRHMKENRSLEQFESLLDSISNVKEVPIFNFDHKFRDEEVPRRCYLNTQHLNYQGAKLFTRDLALFLAGLEQ